jgi:membrane protease subunit HflK
MCSDILNMVWNEPGNGNNNRKNDGPPDLEEIFNNFFKKLSAAFGRDKKPGESSNDNNNNNLLISAVLLISLVGYFVIGFYSVYPFEQAVITRFGLHWHPRFIDRVIKVKTENIVSSKHGGWMLTKDENILMVEIEVQYRVLDAEKYLFNVTRPDDALREAGDSALRQVIGDSMTDDVLTDKKMQIAESIKEQLIKILKVYDTGIFVQNVNYKDSRPPEEVKDSFDDVTKAREDRERLKLQADAFTNNILPEAEGKAKKMLLEAEAYKAEVILKATGEAAKFNLMQPEYAKAPKVTKYRMYMDTMEAVMQNTSKILVDVDKGNNVIYLPLDKIIAGGKKITKTESVKNE